MNLAKTLIRLLLIASVIGGGIYIAKQKKIVQNSEMINEFEEKKEKLQGSVQGVTDNISQQTEQLTKRGREISEHVGNVLGTYIKPTNDKSESKNSQNSSTNQLTENGSISETSSSQDGTTGDTLVSEEQSKPIYEETFEYGRYLYCQQVIKDYEENH